MKPTDNLTSSTVQDNRTFDRLIEFDEKSRQYPIRALIGDKPLRSYTWSCAQHLDQGNEGACVGFAWTHEFIARPQPIKGLDATFAHDRIYLEAQKLDEWPGEDYEGTSVLGGAKAAVAVGLIKEYRWAFGLQDALLALSYSGPGIAGVNWYEDMRRPDAKGFVKPTGGIAGGHAILVKGINAKKGFVTLHNSWGADWGKGGDCYMTFEDFDILLKDNGEFCVPTVRAAKLPAPVA